MFFCLSHSAKPYSSFLIPNSASCSTPPSASPTPPLLEEDFRKLDALLSTSEIRAARW